MAERKLTRLIVPWPEAHRDLRTRIELGESLQKMRIGSVEENIYGETVETSAPAPGVMEKARIWDSYNYDLLRRIFDTDEYAGEYGDYITGDLEKDLRLKLTILRSILGKLAMLALETPLMKMRADPAHPRSVDNGKVFLVHGRDVNAKNRVENFLRKGGLNVIVLEDQPNLGQVLIEKVEANSDVAYAVIVATPDDFGGLEGGAEGPRARENVIFETGFFIGKIGRARVAFLHRVSGSVPLGSRRGRLHSLRLFKRLGDQARTGAAGLQP